MELWEELNNEIEIQQIRIKDSFKGQDKRVAVIEIIRGVDHVFTVASFIVTKFEKSEELAKWHELFSVQTNGLYGALLLFLDESANDPWYPIFPTNNEYKDWVNSCLISMGNIGFAKRFLELSKSGVIQLNRIELNKLKIKIPAAGTGYELTERQDIEWVKQLRIKKSKNVKGKNIGRLLNENVRVWRDHYIAYDSTPELDRFYEEKGKIYARLLDGYDAFTDSTLFNAIPFSDYKKVLASLIGLTLKHRDCCFKLISKIKYQKIDPWNIYTLPERFDDLSFDLASHLKLPVSNVQNILEELTLTLSNIRFFENHSGGPPPPLIKIGKDHVLRSITGSLSNPHFFLLRMLKEKYPTDYSKAVNLRERVFRDELYELFNQTFILKCIQPIKLKINDRIATDIDAILFDRNSKSITLFQLKWMEPFGNSMKERFSRAENFVGRSEKWIDSVVEWLGNYGEAGLAQRLSEFLPPNTKIEKIYLFVVGRYYSLFSGKEHSKRAVWINWSRILRFKEKKPDVFKSLDNFYQSSIDELILNKAPIQVDDEVVRVGKFEIVITKSNQ